VQPIEPLQVDGVDNLLPHSARDMGGFLYLLEDGGEDVVAAAEEAGGHVGTAHEVVAILALGAATPCARGPGDVRTAPLVAEVRHAGPYPCPWQVAPHVEIERHVGAGRLVLGQAHLLQQLGSVVGRQARGGEQLLFDPLDEGRLEAGGCLPLCLDRPRVLPVDLPPREAMLLQDMGESPEWPFTEEGMLLVSLFPVNIVDSSACFFHKSFQDCCYEMERA
jgi:hypothetical protein